MDILSCLDFAQRLLILKKRVGVLSFLGFLVIIIYCLLIYCYKHFPRLGKLFQVFIPGKSSSLHLSKIYINGPVLKSSWDFSYANNSF